MNIGDPDVLVCFATQPASSFRLPLVLLVAFRRTVRPASSASYPDYLKFGYTFEVKATCDLRKLVLDTSAPANGPDASGLPGMAFYELFLVTGGMCARCVCVCV